LRISIIGAGRVGRALGRVAFLAGHDIEDVVCRSRASAAAAARFIGGGTPRGWSGAVIRPADLFLVSTPDDVIPKAVELIRGRAGLSSRSTRGRPDGHRMPTVLHTSGALSSLVLAPLERAGFVTGSCHPLQTFESPARSISSIRRSYFCIEGEPKAVRVARKLVTDIGGRFFEIPTEQKGLYNAGAVLGSGGITALISISLEILSRCGLSEKDSRKVLFPLIEGTIANIQAVGPALAMTGPIRRGDAGTVKRNTQALSGVHPDWARIYKLLAKRALILLS
jgi:predicted short-subunit dehydrogenase-like oxidoreductase (DUF2520 family)